jgi:hypothetical protein
LSHVVCRVSYVVRHVICRTYRMSYVIVRRMSYVVRRRMSYIACHMSCKQSRRRAGLLLNVIGLNICVRKVALLMVQVDTDGLGPQGLCVTYVWLLE